MTDNDAEAWARLLEIGCKFILYLFGFAIVLSAVVFSFGGPVAQSQIESEDFLVALAIWVSGFIVAFYWYLWHTKGGLRLLDRVWSGRRQLTGLR